MNWSLSWTVAPPGLTFDTESGAISGVPTEAGVYEGVITETATGLSESFSLNIFRPNRRFIAEALSDLPTGVSLLQEDPSVFGGSEPCLQGTPTVAGTYSISIRFHDRSGQTADFAATLVVS